MIRRTLAFLTLAPLLLATACGDEKAQNPAEGAALAVDPKAKPATSPDKTDTEKANWDGVEVLGVDTSDPHWAHIRVKVHDPKDRYAIELSLSPYVKATQEKLGKKEEGVERFVIHTKRLKPGLNTFEATFKHYDGRTRTETITIDRRPAMVLVEGKISCNLVDCKGNIDWSGDIRIEVAEGSKLTLDGKTEVAGAGPVNFEVDAISAALQAGKTLYAAGSAEPKWLLEKSLEIEFPDGKKLEKTLRWDARRLQWAIADALEPVKEGKAVRFADEPAAPASRRKGALLWPLDRLGAIEQPSDIDLVAFLEEKKSAKSCGVYRSKASGNTTRVGIDYTDFKVTVYERRSGKRIDSKSIKAERMSCPKEKEQYKRLRSSANRADVRGYLSGLLSE